MAQAAFFPDAQGNSIATSLMPLAARGADAGQVATAAITVWVQVRDALSPVMGQGGVMALFERTVHLAAAQRPWLVAAHDAAVGGEFASLRKALTQQGSEEAAAAHDEMMRILLDLLGKLIGPSLTQRLLSKVWAFLQAGDALQDNLS